MENRAMANPADAFLPPADLTIDTLGLSCPLPVIKMEAALRRLAPGSKLVIRADDPLAAVDIPHFAKAGGHECRRLPGPKEICVFLVTRGENRPSTEG